MTVVRVNYEKTATGFRSIRKHRIYYDTETGEYKIKFRCTECKKDLGCFCFESLNAAIISRYEGLYCDRCGLIDYAKNEDWVLEEVLAILDIPYERNITRAIRKVSDEKLYRVIDAIYDGVEVDFGDFNGWLCKV